MAQAPIGTILGGVLAANASSIPGLGSCVVDAGGEIWYPYGQAVALALNGLTIGIVINSPNQQGSPMQVLVEGAIPSQLFNLGAGTQTTIVAGNTTPSRGTVGQIIGVCDRAGLVFISPSFLGSGITSNGWLTPIAYAGGAVLPGTMNFVDGAAGLVTVAPPALVTAGFWGVCSKKGTFSAGHGASIPNAGSLIEDPNVPDKYNTNPIVMQAPAQSAIWLADPTVSYWKLVA